MKTGHRWLIAGVTGALLLSSGAVRAQTPETPTAPTPGGGSSAGPAGSFQAPPLIRPGQPISVLVFPFGLAEAAAAPAAPAAPAEGTAPARVGLTAAQQEMVSNVTAAVKAGLLSSPTYTVMSYHPQSSLIQRGRKDDILKPEHVEGLVAPETGAVAADRARAVAYRLGIQSVLTGTIDTKEDPATRTVEVTLETQLVDSTTGETLHSAAVSGAAVGAEGVPMSLIRERAAQDAAAKALPAMGIQLVPLPTAQPKDATKDKKGAKVKKTSAERKADREAEEARKKAEKAEKKARRDADKAARASGGLVGGTTQADERLVAQAQPGAPAATPATVTAPDGTRGYTDQAGQPVPYGYALGDTTKALPERNRRRIRVPEWLGVGGFLAALAILL